jgi:plasmid stabilization system protein ParE
MSLRHRLSSVAERDVADIVEYLAKANLDAAIAFIDQLSDRFRQLEQYPESGAQFGRSATRSETNIARELRHRVPKTRRRRLDRSRGPRRKRSARPALREQQAKFIPIES